MIKAATKHFTPEQQLAIDERDRGCIVSAGAGAGKTGTLVERLFSLVTRGTAPLSVDQLLVVTFSRAAAAEMRQRLTQRLETELMREDIADGLRHHLERQLFLLPRASISTISSFCLEAISAYSERSGLPPGFATLSDEEETLRRREFLRARIDEELLAGASGAAAISAISKYAAPLSALKDVEELAFDFQRFLESLADPKTWCAEQLKATRECAAGTLPDTTNALRKRLLEDDYQRLERGFEGALSFRRDLAPKLQPLVTALHGARERIATAFRTGAAFSHKEINHPTGTAALKKEYRGEEFIELRNGLKKPLENFLARLATLTPDSLTSAAAAQLPALTWFLETVGGTWLDRYAEELTAERLVTFSRIEELATHLFADGDGTPTDVAAVFRARFEAILVDEYQDTNEKQELILRSIARCAPNHVPLNLFRVGDVKQSIYEFRQADPTLFLRTYAEAKPVGVAVPEPTTLRIDLQSNFRSEPLLLHEFNRLFSRLLLPETIGVDYAKDHAFRPGLTQSKGTPRLTLTFFHETAKSDQSQQQDGEDGADPGAEDAGELHKSEALAVVDSIARIGPPWRRIAVLVHTRAGTLGQLTPLLEARGIPYVASSRDGFLKAIEVVELQSILLSIYNPYDDLALLSYLRGPSCQWSEDDLLLLRLVDREGFYFDNLEEAGRRHPLIAEKSAVALQRLVGWREVAAESEMVDLFARIYADLDLLEVASVRTGGEQRRQNLLQLLEHAQTFDSFRQRGLGWFLLYLEELDLREKDFAPPPVLQDDADVVRIMTIHQSKGMEFPVVFVPFLGKKMNEMSLRKRLIFDREYGVALNLKPSGDKEPADPCHMLLKEVRRQKMQSERLRVLYVAATRAECELHFSATLKKLPEMLQDAVAAVASAPDPTAILGAKRFADWLLPFAVETFPEAANAELPFQKTRGILTLNLAEASEAPVESSGEIGSYLDTRKSELFDSLPSRIDAALSRIEQLEAAMQQPSVRAKITVTEAKRAYDALLDPQIPPAFHERRRPFTAEESELRRQRGTLVHRFLAMMHLEEIGRRETDLAAELHRLIADGTFTNAEASSIDLTEIDGFFGSALGRRIMAAAGTFQRERGFTILVHPADLQLPDLAEPVVLQGVIDLLFQEDGRWILVDYKTDDTGPGGRRIPALTATYRAQLQLYRLLVERTLGEEIAESWLVFLRAGQAVAIEDRIHGAAAWRNILRAGLINPERNS